MKQLDKIYSHLDVEDRIYAGWMEKNYFHAEVDYSRTPYTIVIPPPNITGQLHMGHALNNTLQDIIIRYKRMRGYNTLWLPGTDHASISTEVRIADEMAKEGLTKKDIGREAFLERAWKWKEVYGGRILQQLKKFGSSCDWARERFTMDKGLSRAVTEVFCRLYDKGWIYRGEKLINWCPKCRTTISDAEVNHEDMTAFLYHIKYPIENTGEYLTFATTRPETILADTALAVNPEDERYKRFVGKTAAVPIVNRVIPVIADDYCDMKFGTGVVKITPGHDPNDFLVGERHNLPIINVLNDDGTMNENAGEYAGMDRFECREKVLARLTALGLFVKKEELTHSVGVHERCGEVIEPLIKLQWFVKMDDMAKPALDALKTGKLRIIPERFGKIYSHWLENIRDWCISRQLWWGHRIPAYYCADCGHIEVARSRPEKCSKCGCLNLTQDEDTLDTWFSSALWPFSTLGWPDETEDLKYFYPTNLIVTAQDIIFFWVIRMMFSGIEQMGEVPFHEVFINGIIRDSQGRKMSKSLGNGIDPLDLIQDYGADTLRFTLVTGTAPGNDSRFYYERMDANRTFLNKIWNATRFVMMNLGDATTGQTPVGNGLDRSALTQEDKWILSRLNTVTAEVTQNIEDYEIGLAVQKIYDFIWSEYCDWYIEMVKPRLYNPGDATRGAALWTLKHALITALKLLHPFMPFITEEIFTSIQNDEETIMFSKWPEYDEGLNFPAEERAVSLVRDAIRGIRNLRLEMGVHPTKKSRLRVVSEDADIRAAFENGVPYLKSLGFASEVAVSDKIDSGEQNVPIVVQGATLYLPFAELVDAEKERERLTAERDKLLSEVARVDGKLANQGFVSKAPASLIDEEKRKRVKYADMLQNVEKQLEALSV